MARWQWPKPEMSLGQWLGICFHTLGNGQWKPPTRGQLGLAQIIEQPHLDRVAITGFRGLGKSVITASAVTWFWRFISPNLKILVISSAHDKAKDFAYQVKKLLDTVPELEHLRPTGSRGLRQEIDAFDIANCIPEQSRSLRSYGLSGRATGGRCDILIFDDIEEPEVVRTQHMRERVWAKVQEYWHMMKPREESPAKAIDLGTPHTEESVHNRLVNEAGFARFLWPALYPDESLQSHMGRDLHPLLRRDLLENPKVVGQPTDPERFDTEELEFRRVRMPSREWRLQWMLDTRVADQDQYPLKIQDLMIMDLDVEVGPELALYSRTCVLEDLSRDYCVGWDGDRFHHPSNIQEMRYKPWAHKMVFVDPSGKGRDETAYCVLGYLNGYLAVLDWGGFKEGYTEKTLDSIIDIGLKWECSGIVSEDNFGSGMFNQLLIGQIKKRKAALGVDSVTVKGRKEDRIISTLRPVLEKHRLILNRSVVINDYLSTRSLDTSAYSALYQLSRMTEEKGALRHDDRVDALALGAAYYQDMMAMEATDAIAADERRDMARFVKEMQRPLEGLLKKDVQRKLARTPTRYGFKRHPRTTL